MQSQKDRVIIDTNLWISFLVTNDLSKFDVVIGDGEATLVFSQGLVDEFVEVSQRKKFRKYFDLDDVEYLLLKINETALFVNVISNVTICRDPKDNFLLSLALDGGATHLITGDKDLLVLKEYGNTKILTITQYLESRYGSLDVFYNSIG